MNTTTFKNTAKLFSLHLAVLCFLLFPNLSFSQAVTNGSVTGAPVGNSAIGAGNAPGWTVGSGSPDLCDVSFPNYTAASTLTPCASPNGGTWLGLAAITFGEMAKTTITGLTVGTSYTLAYYGSCFGTTGTLFNSSPAQPKICVGTTCQTISIPKVACVWNNYTLTFTATATTMLLEASNISPDNSTYANLDGFRFVNPLGIELTSFTVNLNHLNQTEVNWTTNSEVNNDYFTILRSLNGVDWIEIGKIKGAGNSTITIDYATLDLRPKYGVNYYKLKQTDFNGQETYSSIASVNVNISNEELEIYPNPATTEFELHSSAEELTKVNLYTITGENVTNSVEWNCVSSDFIIVSTNQLSPGVYILKTVNKISKITIY